MADILGTDIAVTPFFVAHDAAALDLVPVTRVQRTATPGAIDLASLSGRENLAQALLLRLLTPRGSLAALGHAAYGSRLHELIGRRKTPALRDLCRAFVLEVVAQEPRVVDKAVSLAFDEKAETLDAFVFTLVVQPKSGDAPVGLSLEVAL